MNLASSEAMVMVTVDPVDDHQGGVHSASITSDQALVYHSSSIEQQLNLQQQQEGQLLDLACALTDPGVAPPGSAAIDTSIKPSKSVSVHDSHSEDLLGVEIAESSTDSEKTSSRKPIRPEPKKVDSQTRTTPTNPMSVSVPNLTSSMEQTVSLLESFAAVARRNIGNNSNNMARCNNAASLVSRLASSANSPSKYAGLLEFVFVLA